MKLKILFVLILPAFIFSCITLPKNISYFQDLNEDQENVIMKDDMLIYEPVIKKYDEMLITVTAPVLDQEAVAQFNLPMMTYLVPGESNVQQSLSIQTYIVENDGCINYPVIGRIPLAGLTKSQAIDCLKKSISDYITDPVVVLKIISFKVTVLGEVMKPGHILVTQEKISVLDAIGAAGDMTIYGNRNNVLLIRENINGSIDYHRVDLTTSKIFTSPFYYLQQNDKIIVEANKTKQLESKYGLANSYKLSVFSLIFSTISIVASTTLTIITIINKK